MQHKRPFRKEMTLSWKRVYIDIGMEKKRLDVLEKMKRWEMTSVEFRSIQAEMRKDTQKWKHMFFELPDHWYLVK